MEPFFSKRNKVFLRGGIVVKRFSDPESAETESELLRGYYLAGVPVPQVYERQNNEIWMEYIPGDTIPDFLLRMEKKLDCALLEKAAQELCRWFELFYEAVDHTRSGEIRGDVNGRNFIIASNLVVSVDFEERAFGSAEQDIGRLLAFICTYKLSETSVKRRFSRVFARVAVERLSLSTQETLKEFRLELSAMKKRRGIKNWL